MRHHRNHSNRATKHAADTGEARTADRAIASLRKAIEQLAAGRPRDALAMVANAQDSASELRGMIERLIPL